MSDIWPWHDAYKSDLTFICETWLIHMWDMTHSYVSYASFICEPWFLNKDDSLHVRHDSFIRDMTLSLSHTHDSAMLAAFFALLLYQQSSVCVRHTCETFLCVRHSNDRQHEIQKLRFLGTISIWICTAGYWEIRALRFGGFRRCSIFSVNCQITHRWSIVQPIAFRVSFNLNL